MVGYAVIDEQFKVVAESRRFDDAKRVADALAQASTNDHGPLIGDIPADYFRVAVLTPDYDNPSTNLVETVYETRQLEDEVEPF